MPVPPAMCTTSPVSDHWQYMSQVSVSTIGCQTGKGDDVVRVSIHDHILEEVVQVLVNTNIVFVGCVFFFTSRRADYNDADDDDNDKGTGQRCHEFTFQLFKNVVHVLSPFCDASLRGGLVPR